MLLKVLHSLGFSEKEANLYTVLLRLGPQPASVVARKAGLNRSTAYAILNHLAKKGFVVSFNQSKIQYFSPCSPDALLEFVERQKRLVTQQEKRLRSFLPALKQMMGSDVRHPPKFSFYERHEGLRIILDQVVHAAEAPLCFLNLDDWISGSLQNLKPYLEAIFRSDARCFVVDSLFSRDFLKQFPVKFHFLAECGCQFFIYNNKLAVIFSDVGFVIENKEIVQLQRTIFDMLWGKS